MTAQQKTAKQIFLEAIESHGPAHWPTFVKEVCGTDGRLRRRVEILLAAHIEDGNLLDHPAIAPAAISDPLPPPERCGTWIGPYKLLEQIGEGGFGVVFMAEQVEPVCRQVAVKVIKPGMDTRQVLSRFSAERKALAVMDHPNIARVLDVGATDSGRPYFVMELVRGIPITQYCDDLKLMIEDRLELFVSVCHAIQHAHTKGIIHRDIKPSNVLVLRHEGNSLVKVIDFGVAKAIGQQLTGSTLLTDAAQMIGTPQYMSPEQAAFGSVDIDTRSDVYSLGVLLYELVTGTTPVSAQKLALAGIDEMRRIIREVEPQKPSARVSSAETAPIIAVQRNTEPAKLIRRLRGELDWIVMKALEKDRDRRYETTSGFARDIHHYLHHEPVRAGPPSTWYRVRKFAQRNRGAFVVASMTALLLLAAAITLAISNARIRQEQARTHEERDRAERAQKLAQNRAAEIQRGLDSLSAANALLDRGRWYVTVRRWDDAQTAFTKAIELRPDHVSAWIERGNLYTHLGLWDRAADNFAQDITLHKPDTTLRWYQHALLRLHVDDRAGYDQACRQMRDRFRGTLIMNFTEDVVRGIVLDPPSDTDLSTLVDLSQEVVSRQPWSSYSLYLLGIALYRAGQYETATERLREALTVTDWPNRLLSHPVLAMAYHRLGRAVEARNALDDAARVLEQWTMARYPNPEDHWVQHQGADAVWPVIWWDWLECQHYYCEAKLLIDGVPPPEDPRLHVLRARSLAGLRRNKDAERDYDAALELNPHDRQIQIEARRNRGYCRVGDRQWAEAATEFTAASELAKDDVTLWRFRAMAQLAAEDNAAYRQSCLAMYTRFHTTDDRRVAEQVILTCVLKQDALADMNQLVPLARLAASTSRSGAYLLGAALYRAGKYDETIQCLEAGARLYRPRAWESTFLAMAHGRLGHDGEARRCLAEAARWIESANRQTDDDLTGTRAAWGAWFEPVFFPRLLREAEALVQP